MSPLERRCKENLAIRRAPANLGAAGAGYFAFPARRLVEPLGLTPENFLTNSGIYEKNHLILTYLGLFTLGDSGVARRRQPLYRTYVIYHQWRGIRGNGWKTPEMPFLLRQG
jgi:hypothetical protein